MLFDNRTLQVSLWSCKNNRWNIDHLNCSANLQHSLSFPGQFLHRPYKNHPVQDLGLLVPADLHQQGARLLFLPSERAFPMGLLFGAPAAASLHGPASPALHQRIMTKNLDYDLLLTASVWEAKKDYDKEKKNQGKLPRCHEDLLSLVIGWPLWTMVHYFSFGFLLLFSRLSLHQPYHTTSLTHSVHNQNFSLFFLWFHFFF